MAIKITESDHTFDLSWHIQLLKFNFVMECNSSSLILYAVDIRK
jgi:hypothetical protein